MCADSEQGPTSGTTAPREISFLLPDEQNGVRRLCALVFGQRDAPLGAMLCIHGFQDNANSFFFLGPRLAQLGFFVVCVELTGHGRSDHGLSNHFSYAYDVVDVADSLQLPRFHIIGHSMGAVVASLVAGSLTSRVLSLVMIDAIGVVGSFSDAEAPELLETSLNQRSAMISRRPRVYDTFEECLQRWAESPFAPRGRENVQLIVARGSEEIVDPNGFVTGFRFRHDPRLKMAPPFKISEAASQGKFPFLFSIFFSLTCGTEFLKRVKCPTAVLLATDREAFFPDFLEKIHLDLLRARVFRMSGGHHLHMTNVEGTMEAIETLYREGGFLKEMKSKL